MKSRFNFHKSKLILTLALALVISFGFISLKDKEFDIVRNFDIFYSLFRELNFFYVDDTKPDKLIESAIEGMLTSLDPYTSFIPEKDMEDYKFMTTGEYGGIGAIIRRGGDYAMVLEPYENFPAQVAGLKAGDTILSIDGVSTKGKDIATVSELLKGTPNTAIKVKLKRIGTRDVMEKTFTRKKITIPNVPFYDLVEDRVGYIRLSGFTRDAGRETRDALEQLKERGATSIILDLRGNPGGLLIESVNVSNLFIGKDQEIVSTKGKVKQWDNIYKTALPPVDTAIPLVVLVNRGSASASEIVAGALQDLDRAIIIGQRTFGKGLVQTTRPLSYNAQLKVTTAKYYIPSGRCIQAVDYANRNEDGSVGYIPDSLIREFSTRNGRKVFDGGGIVPDFTLTQDQLSNITISLFTKNLIFDYATLFAANHKEFGMVSDLKVSAAEYKKFLDYISDKSYDYTTSSDDQLDELVKIARREKYYEGAEKEFEALKSKLAHDKSKDLQTFKNEIQLLLYEEIASRYFYQKGRIQASLDDDPELARAVEVLSDPQLYTSVLKSSFTIANTKTGMKGYIPD
ncbi:MAG TPA: S41 family peptidase [Bacteroidales bacterium]|nr:S41 family peptidase [Bacteroidales bacterium]